MAYVSGGDWNVCVCVGRNESLCVEGETRRMMRGDRKKLSIWDDEKVLYSLLNWG